MTRTQLLSMWETMRLGQGIMLRLIACLPEDQLDSHPIPNMRTPKQLVVHLYADVFRGLIDGVDRGTLDGYDAVYDSRKTELETADRIRTRDELLRFASECWESADRIARTSTETKLETRVKAPWGKSYTGYELFAILEKEFLHHRGQLVVFARALGVQPPDIWDFKNNDPAFRPNPENVKA